VEKLIRPNPEQSPHQNRRAKLPPEPERHGSGGIGWTGVLGLFLAAPRVETTAQV
jgi:hypothetical protein